MQTISFHEYEFSRLMLGTVQFGLSYGVANTKGQPAFGDVCAMLEQAYAGGVNCLDTAPAYGESEAVLGRALKATGLSDKMHVVSKAMRRIDEAATPAEIARTAAEEIAHSLELLQLDVLPLCLMHWEGSFHHFDALVKAKEKGLVRHIGCSITDVTRAREVLRSGLVEAMQIPLNLLDRRLIGNSNEAESFLDEAHERGVAIFTRSAYLQGLLLMQPDAVPAHLNVVVPALVKLRELAQANQLPIEELVLRYVLSLRGVDCAVIGVDTAEQLQSNIEIFTRGELSGDVIAQIDALVPGLPDEILNPYHWPQLAAQIK